MQIESEATVHIPAAREIVWEYATDPDKFPSLFSGYGPIPGIERVENVGGEATTAGTVRNIHNADGSVFEEHILEFDAPTSMRYRLVSGFKPPFSLMIRHGEGQWTFTEENSGIRVTWHFAFELTSPLVVPVAMPIVKLFFHGAQEQCLKNLKQQVINAPEAAA